MKVNHLFRKIYSVELEELKIQGEDFVIRFFFVDEFTLQVVASIHGVSFVLHQIRKMMSYWLVLIHVSHRMLVILSLNSQGHFPEKFASLPISSPFKFPIPPAPPQGPTNL